MTNKCLDRLAKPLQRLTTVVWFPSFNVIKRETLDQSLEIPINKQLSRFRKRWLCGYCKKTLHK